MTISAFKSKVLVAVSAKINSQQAVSQIIAAQGTPVLNVDQFTRTTDLMAYRNLIADEVLLRIAPSCQLSKNDIDEVFGTNYRTIVKLGESTSLVNEKSLIEICDVDELASIRDKKFSGLIIRGNEAHGRCGRNSHLTMLEQILNSSSMPVWITGGIGKNFARGAVLAGASGVLLEQEFALYDELHDSDRLQSILRRANNADTQVVEGRRTILQREYDLAQTEAVELDEANFLASQNLEEYGTLRQAVHSYVLATSDEELAKTGRLIAEYIHDSDRMKSVFGTRLPIAQGPMARVSDKADFARKVAQKGGLPFIALASSSPEKARALLKSAKSELGNLCWGAGCLGFLPKELIDKHITTIIESKPQWALIAGGKSSQVHKLEKAGINVLVHAPAPSLLRHFLDDGLRKFVFEGSECGGHLGPLHSSSLWEIQIELIKKYMMDTGDKDITVVLAGGIHDAKSAAVAFGMSKDIIALGGHVGLQIGTGYLLTEEAVSTKAITKLYQDNLISAKKTSVLTTAPGHSIRCIETPYVDEFEKKKKSLEDKGEDARSIWETLETMNLGRLRIASAGEKHQGHGIIHVSPEQQIHDGMYMAGEVAIQESKQTTIEDLHNSVTVEVSKLLETFDNGKADVKHYKEITACPASPNIAIVGMAGAFAGAHNLAEYWANIMKSVVSISEVPKSRWNQDVYFGNPQTRAPQSDSCVGGFLPAVPFDPLKYGIPPASLSSIDPAQLLALDMADRALNDAHLDNLERVKKRTAVVFGVESGGDLGSSYSLRINLPAFFGGLPPAVDDMLPDITADSFPGMLSNVVSGRISNRLNLGGLSCTIDAACASSLAAVSAACSELRSGRCDVALAGGVDVHNGINDYIMFSSLGALSKTGRSRVFDKNADGIVLGEGVGCIVLKRVEDAKRDGDRVYAVIAGIGSSSDGKALGLTAPRVSGQVSAIKRALSNAHIDAGAVTMIEAHGTGTSLGDQSELESLSKVFGRSSTASEKRALGAIKTQIGHAKCAAGMASLIKSALSVYTGILPPMVGPDCPISLLESSESPFKIIERPTPWITQDDRRIAGVSAFGFGGTNFHMLLERNTATSYPLHGLSSWPAELFVISGHNEDEMVKKLRRLQNRIRQEPNDFDLAKASKAQYMDFVHADEPVQAIIVTTGFKELDTQITKLLAGSHHPSDRIFMMQHRQPGKVAVLFPGQGSQYVGMGDELLSAFPQLNNLLSEYSKEAPYIYPGKSFAPKCKQQQQEDLKQTKITQPALGAISMAYYELLRWCGLTVDAFAGHSYGEIVALSAGGAFDVAELAHLSRKRGLAMTSTGGQKGCMAAIFASGDDVSQRLREAGIQDVVVANYNSTKQCVISGTESGVDTVLQLLKTQGLSGKKLNVSNAFHSPLMASAAKEFAKTVKQTAFHSLQIPVMCARTAKPYISKDIASELVLQIDNPVKFVNTINALYDAGVRTFIELGPGQVLSKLVADTVQDKNVLSTSFESSGRGIAGFLCVIAQLLTSNIDMNISWLFNGRLFQDEQDDLDTQWSIDGQVVRDSNNQPIKGSITVPANPSPSSFGLSEPAIRKGSETQESVPTDVGDHLFDDTYNSTDQLDNIGEEAMQTNGNGQAAVVKAFLEAGKSNLELQAQVVAAYLAGSGSQQAISANSGDRDNIQDQPFDTLQAVISEQKSNVESAASHSAEPHIVQNLSDATQLASVSKENEADVFHDLSEHSSETEDLTDLVKKMIADATGYPTNMITDNLDLESDLSIDSIKRTEIAGSLLSASGIDSDSLTEEEMENLSSARTVNAIVKWLGEHGKTGRGHSSGPKSEKESASGDDDLNGDCIQRFVFRKYPLVNSSRIDVIDTFALFAPTGIKDDLVAEFNRHQILLDEKSNHMLYVCDPKQKDSACAVDKVFKDLQYMIKDIGAPFTLLIVSSSSENAGKSSAGRIPGLRGMVRCLVQDFPESHISLLELSSVDHLPSVVSQWLSLSDKPSITLWDKDEFYSLRLTPEQLNQVEVGSNPQKESNVDPCGTLGLSDTSVILAIGGGRGITAQTVEAISSLVPGRFILSGSTELMAASELSQWEDAKTLPQLRSQMGQSGVALKDVNNSAKKILANREIVDTMDCLSNKNCSVEYIKCDVRDKNEVSKLVKQVVQKYGQIDLIIYGAGITRDHLFLDATSEDLIEVSEIKRGGMSAILEALARDHISPDIIGFGSVASTVGNRGQVVYAIANDELECVLQEWGRDSCHRAVTINWGAWAPDNRHQGMVVDDLARQFTKNGIGLLNPADAVKIILPELAWGNESSVSYANNSWAIKGR